MDVVANVVSLADVCIRCGIILVKTCKSYRDADEEIAESVLLIETRWHKIQRQLELLRNIWSSLDEEYQIHQNSVLQVLYGKAQAAISLIDSVVGKSNEEPSMRSLLRKKGETRRLRYAVMVKDRLNSVQTDLKDWSEVFDVSWYLIIRLADRDIEQEVETTQVDSQPVAALKGLRDAIKSNLTDSDEKIKTTVLLSPDFLNGSQTRLEYSSSEIWSKAGQIDRYLVDQESNISNLSDVCKLAKILRKVNAFDFGILPCAGVVRTSTNTVDATGSRLIFRIPDLGSDAQYLRSLILSDFNRYPLDDRLSLAKEIAKSVMFVHSAGFVHKNIRPEIILTMRPSLSEPPHAFLTGFESFRLAEGITMHQGDDSWEKNLYRHPTRQGVRPEVDYCMQHDIYSLGVCLLEFGMGTSLVIYHPGNSSLAPSPAIAEVVLSDVRDARKKGFNLKRRLIELAEQEVPAKMGRKFAGTVVTCLTCLDKTGNRFGSESEFLDENGVLVGVRFIEKILIALLELRI